MIDPAPKSAGDSAEGRGRRRLLRLLPALLLVALALGAWRAGLPQMLSLQSLARHQAQMHQAVDARPVLSVAAYVAVFTILTAACVPVALVMTLISGALFGPVVGGGATVVGALLGSLVTYAAARTALASWLRARAERDRRLKAVMDGFGENAFSYILTLRFIPVAPFSGVNIAAGLAAVPVRAFLLATLLAALVTSFLFASLGAGLGQSLADPRSVKETLERPILIVPMIGLAALALLPVLVKRWRARVRRPPTT